LTRARLARVVEVLRADVQGLVDVADQMRQQSGRLGVGELTPVFFGCMPPRSWVTA
jgi:hypothetical protein